MDFSEMMIEEIFEWIMDNNEDISQELSGASTDNGIFASQESASDDVSELFTEQFALQ